MKERILEVLKNAEKPLRPGEIAAALGEDKDAVSKAIKELKAEEKVYSPVRCCYAVVE
ncbi:MAG: MarR family transcriptional regulator [Oscillospiraceae bacterium]|nr:MarR family transcriptional regulator [Oscillospiraceae bacterium]MBR2041631.1 MarR family transcriptional regulator [Oscillospiraceae bacterium]MBR3597813.1 MarR family transcriptional regulator [Clostridia bacterium]MBR3952077.1 MarR family transcriptional regulator [Oscillospiraceae bacterium]